MSPTTSSPLTAPDRLRVLVVRPGEPPAIETISHTLADLQAVVGGYLERWASVDHVVILCNEDGRARQLPYNRRITLPDGLASGFYGTVLLVGFDPDSGEMTSLTDADLDVWHQQLLHPAQPEIRHRTNHTRWTREGRRSRLTLQFDANGLITTTSARTWARSVARDWGTIHAESRVRLPDFPGWIGWFSCSGHGGYVVITQTPRPEWAEFAEEGALCQPEHAAAFHHTTVFTFEEDCNYAVLESVLPAVAAWALRERLTERTSSASTTPEERAQAAAILADPAQWTQALADYRVRLRGVLSRWHPEWVPSGHSDIRCPYGGQPMSAPFPSPTVQVDPALLHALFPTAPDPVAGAHVLAALYERTAQTNSLTVTHSHRAITVRRTRRKSTDTLTLVRLQRLSGTGHRFRPDHQIHVNRDPIRPSVVAAAVYDRITTWGKAFQYWGQTHGVWIYRVPLDDEWSWMALSVLDSVLLPPGVTWPLSPDAIDPCDPPELFRPLFPENRLAPRMVLADLLQQAEAWGFSRVRWVTAVTRGCAPPDPATQPARAKTLLYISSVTDPPWSPKFIGSPNGRLSWGLPETPSDEPPRYLPPRPTVSANAQQLEWFDVAPTVLQPKTTPRPQQDLRALRETAIARIQAAYLQIPFAR